MPEKRALQKNALEWIVFAASCVLVLGVVGYLGYVSMTLGDSPPKVEVTIGKAEKAGEYYRVPIEVENRGDRTAESVHIEIVLERNGKEVEKGDVDVAFLPRQSPRTIEVTFKTDPRQGELSSRVLGFEKP
jgi:uncharacterized protein (TIGR02588 family)